MIIFDYDWNLLYGISHGNLYFPQAPSQAENTLICPLTLSFCGGKSPNVLWLFKSKLNPEVT